MRRIGFAALALGAVACGGRPDSWGTPLDVEVQSVGLTGSVALVDEPLDRVVMVTSPSGRDLATHPLAVGENVVTAVPSADRESLFVLSRGIQPRRNPDDEEPSLTVIDGGLSPKVAQRFVLTDPLEGLAVDPLGEWAVVFDAGGVVVNPNELILVPLDGQLEEAFPKTIRSYGSSPQRLTFTTELTLPKGPARRLLVVETDVEVHLVDLAYPDRDEVTVPLPKTATGDDGRPAEVAFHDGDPADPLDARLAVRMANDSSVVLVELGQPLDDEHDFRVLVNLVDVGSVPSAIDFVRTDGGLRLAALVPDRREAVLVDPATTLTERVDLKAPYRRITRVTEDVANAPVASDVALLWSEQARQIAFWSLGQTSGTPYASVDSYGIDITVNRVLEVPGEAYGHLKILQSAADEQFYILDLDERQSFPMDTEGSNFQLYVSPDGERVWALKPGSDEFAGITFSNLHPDSLSVEREVSAVYDIERADGGRSALALHVGRGSVGATVLNAIDPDTGDSRFYTGLLFGGLQ